MMVFRQRIRLFVRDYLNEFGVAWSVARHRDCERNGGHRWGDPFYDEPFGTAERCTRCGTTQGVFSDEHIPNPDFGV